MLTLLEPGAEVRERFLSGQMADGEQAGNPLLACWERVIAHGLSADGAGHAVGVSRAQLLDRRERVADLLRGQSTLLEPLARDFASRSLVAVVADHEGVIVHRHGGGDFAQTAALVQLTEGARWSEDVRGTNAIGTAIVERRPVAVIGGAHFENKAGEIFCYASPVFAPQGDLICVLNVSGPLRLHDPAVGVAVRAAASALEVGLRTNALDGAVTGGLSALARLIERLREPAFVLDIRGQLLCHNAAAPGVLDELGLRTDEAPKQLRRWCEAAQREGKLLVEGRRRSHMLTLDPLFGPDARLLALLVTVNPVVKLQRSTGSVPPLSGPQPSAAFEPVLGTDPALLREKTRAEAYARTDLPVLLLAETGTGKELFARAIHAASPRSGSAFVAINCAAVPQSLLESELFGYAPAAFTGASARGSEGKVAAAHRGTLFLDEIGDMPAALQALLLRFLDDGTYYRVGDSQPRKADVRIVCATCRDLPARVRAGDFRQDLFYRIQGACVSPPPLRERTDRVWLAEQMLAADGGRWELTVSAQEYIESHSWPGNVRELKSALLHARALSPGDLIDSTHFAAPLLGEAVAPRNGAPVTLDSVRPRALVLREAVDEALRLTNGNLSEAARRLRMARSTVYRILQRPPS